MSDPVPSVINQYLAASASNDIDALVACFTEDAVVTDEGHTRTGHESIRKWREDVASAYEFTAEVRSSATDGPGRFLVTAHLEGNFPGGEVDLAYRFTLKDGLISALEIAP